MKPLLSLLMMVKNEAPTLRASLDSVRSAVDGVFILDTGSMDETRVIARDFLREAGLKGQIFEEPFVDFATTRNRLLDLHAQHADASMFTLMLSGGETLHDGAALREHLEQYRETGPNAFNLKVKFGEALSFFYPHVLRTNGGWRYEGAAHEVPVSTANREERTPIAPGIIYHVPDSPEKQEKILRERNLPALLKMLEGDIPADARARIITHLAQTYETLADFAPKGVPGGDYLSLVTSAMGYYLRRVEMGGHRDEVSYAWMKYLNCANAIQVLSDHEMLARLKDLVKDTKHPEIAYMFAACLARTAGAERGYAAAVQAALVAHRVREQPPTLMPVDESCEWRARLLAMTCANDLGRTEAAKEQAALGMEARGPRNVFEHGLGGK